MFEIRKRKTGVLIHADIIEESSKENIEVMVNHPAFGGLIAIMPDVHQGYGSVIGFTGKFHNAVIPNVVGVDIGCGVTSYPIGNMDIKFKDFDEYVRKYIPLGFNKHNDFHKHIGNLLDDKLITSCEKISEKIERQIYSIDGMKMSSYPLQQLGTLGGGNHFIEINADESNKYLTVHSGSRNLGQRVANFYQKKAKLLCSEMNIIVPTDTEYLPMSFGGREYIRDMQIAQGYARLNRKCMLSVMAKYFGIDELDNMDIIESTHNYISERDEIVRKGAISAYKSEKVIIPLNMKEGIIIGEGKSNKEYNFSAPHGAGRTCSRTEMFRKLERGEYTMTDFENSMKGIYSTSVKEQTFDESVFSYKNSFDIIDHIKETVDIESILKPIYNLKDDTPKKDKRKKKNK